MHILPLIFATWSYKQRVDKAVEREAATKIGDRRELGQIEVRDVDRPRPTNMTEMSIVTQITNGLTKAERASVRYERTADPIDYTRQATNEVQGSHFMTTELCHVGTDAWGSLKNRLAENGILIDDEAVRIAAAGFYAEHAMQKILGHEDKVRLRDELEGDYVDLDGNVCFDAGWIRKINAHPDAEAIALECFEDLKQHYPAALGVDMRSVQQAIGFDPKVIEVER